MPFFRGIQLELRLLVTHLDFRAADDLLMYYLKLSGFIPKNKQKEFEQTYRLLSTQMPKACRQHSISKDLSHQNVYHFVSYWISSNDVDSFCSSSDFMMLIGAYRTLGELYDNARGELMHANN